MEDVMAAGDKLRRFELIEGAGSHAGPGRQDQVVHTKSGDIVETDQPFDILFPGKWREVGLPKSEVEEAKERKEPILENPALESLRSNRKKISRNEVPREEDSGADGSEPVESPFGDNVTPKFAEYAKSQKAKDLLVWRKGKKYTITHKETPEIANNKEPLVFKDVKRLLKSYQDD